MLTLQIEFPERSDEMKKRRRGFSVSGLGLSELPERDGHESRELEIVYPTRVWQPDSDPFFLPHISFGYDFLFGRDGPWLALSQFFTP